MFVCLYAQFKPANSAVYKKQRDYLVCKIQHRLSLCDHIHWSPFQYVMKQTFFFLKKSVSEILIHITIIIILSPNCNQ